MTETEEQTAQPAPKRSLSRTLRAATGVDETVLDAIPSERGRYAAMGGVVVCVTLIAMFSMGTAITFVFDGFPPAALIYVLIWGAFVFSMDRWLMSVTSTASALERALRLLPRLLLAVAVGTVIAEPLVLAAFNATIVERAHSERRDALLQLESDLLACNPVPGTAEAASAPVGTPRCADRQLTLAGTSVAAQQKQITDLRTQATTLKAVLDKDAGAYAALEAEARRECNGTDGPGLSGQFGQGPNCRRLRAEADRYRSDHRMAENGAALAALRDQIATLTGRIGGDGDAFAAARKQAIDRTISQARADQQGLGLLERMRTLGHLTADNGYARAGEWALRIFLILIDALPVLVKFLGGFTQYDEIVADRVEGQKRGQFEVNRAIEDRFVLGAKLWRESYATQYRVAQERIRIEGVREQLHLESALEDEIDRRVEKLIGEADTITLQLPPGTQTPAAEPAPKPPPPRPAPEPRHGPDDWRDRTGDARDHGGRIDG